MRCPRRFADLRRDWIIARGDVEEYVGREILPQDNGYLTKGAEEVAKIKESGNFEEFPALKRPPLRAKIGQLRNANPLRPQRDHHAGDGIYCDSGKSRTANRV